MMNLPASSLIRRSSGPAASISATAATSLQMRSKSPVGMARWNAFLIFLASRLPGLAPPTPPFQFFENVPSPLRFFARSDFSMASGTGYFRARMAEAVWE